MRFVFGSWYVYWNCWFNALSEGLIVERHPFVGTSMLVVWYDKTRKLTTWFTPCLDLITTFNRFYSNWNFCSTLFWPVTIQPLPKWLIKLKKILQKLDFIVWTSVCSKYLESFFYNTTFLAFLIWYLTFASQKPCDFYQKSIFHCHITCILSKIGLTRYWFFFQGWL